MLCVIMNDQGELVTEFAVTIRATVRKRRIS